MIQQAHSNNLPRLLYTRQEAAKILGLSLRTLDDHVRKGSIKPTRLGRLVRFQPSELERVASDGTVGI